MDPGLQSHVVDQSTCSSGGLRKTRPTRRRRARRIEAQARQALQETADRRVRLQSREVHPDADVGPAREGEVLARVLAAHVEAVRVSANALGSRLAAATETLTRSPSRIAAPPSSTSARRVPIDHRGGGLEPQGLLDRVGQQARVHRDERELVGMGEQVHDRVGDHALGRLDAAEEHDRGVGDDLPSARGRRRRRPAATSRARGRASARSRPGAPRTPRGRPRAPRRRP